MITIKKVTVSDCKDLEKIAKITFSETFLEHNTTENLNNYLLENITFDHLKAQIENRNSLFYIATINDAIVGYLKINFAPAQTELQDKTALEIERIYVLKEYQNQKIGQVFIDKSLSIATEMDLKYIFLGVWEHNLNAIRFYKKNKFEIFDTHFFSIGADIQTDYLMKKIL